MPGVSALLVFASRSFIARERPANKSIGVSVTHLILRFKIVHDLHVFFDATVGNNLLPFNNRATIFFLD